MICLGNSNLHVEKKSCNAMFTWNNNDKWKRKRTLNNYKKTTRESK